MADYDDDLEESEIQGERPPLDPNIRKQLREAEKLKKDFQELQAQLAQKDREVLFSKANIPEDGSGKWFRKGYDGELSLEAIRAAYGTPETIESESSYDSELAALQRTQGATVGNSGAMPDPQQEFLEQLSKATDPTEVMAIIRGTSGQRLDLHAAGEQF